MKTIEKADLDYATLPFDFQKTDVNLRYRWREGKWDDGEETDSELLPIHIAASLFTTVRRRSRG